MTDLDTMVARSLHRAAEQVQPDLDEAWRRQRGRRQRRGRSRPVVMVAAAAATTVLVAGLAVAVSFGDDDPERVATSDPGTASNTPTTATSAPQTASTTAATGLPAEAVAVTTGGELVVVDTSTAEVSSHGEVSTANVLDRHPTDPEEIWFSLCCEPTEGLLRSTRLGGNEVVEQGFGNDPAIDPSGTRLALASTQGLRVVELGTGQEVVYDREAGGGIAAPAWVDGDTIAYQRIVDGTWDLGILHLDESSARVDVIDCASEVSSQLAPVMTPGGLLVSDACRAGGPVDEPPDVPLVFDPQTGEQRTPPPIDYQGEVVAQDEQGGWLLVTYADGRLVAHELATGDSIGLAEGIRTATW